jgi:hypothetical protein
MSRKAPGRTSQARARRDLTLDAGALIALDRGHRETGLVVRRVLTEDGTVRIPAGALGQAWRAGSRQARLADLLSSPRVAVVPLDDVRARAAGVLCGRTATSDVIDASVVLCAREYGDLVLTSDPGDLRRLDADLRIADVSTLAT